jgi:hypothetical protein
MGVGGAIYLYLVERNDFFIFNSFLIDKEKKLKEENEK